MTTETLIAFAGLFFTILAVAYHGISKIANLSFSHGKLTERVDILWEFNLRRGNVELVHKGLADMHSPIVLRVDAFEKIAPFLREFLPAYVGWIRDKPGIKDSEIAELFEQRFGDYIMEHVCVPMGLSEGACLSAIIQACKVTITEKKEQRVAAT